MKPYPPAKLRFHEVTLRTPEEARADELRTLLTDPECRGQSNAPPLTRGQIEQGKKNG